MNGNKIITLVVDNVNSIYLELKLLLMVVVAEANQFFSDL